MNIHDIRIDDRCRVTKTNGVLKFVYPANDISYAYTEYGEPIPQQHTNSLHYLVGEVLLVGTCSVWGFYIPRGNGVHYREFFTNRDVNNQLSHLSRFLAERCSNTLGTPLVTFQPNTRTVDYAGFISMIFNERSHRNFTLLFRALIALFQLKGHNEERAIELSQELVDETLPFQGIVPTESPGDAEPL